MVKSMSIDRYLADPMQGGTSSFVPGHWERRLSDGQYYAPGVTAGMRSQPADPCRQLDGVNGHNLTTAIQQRIIEKSLPR